MPSGPASKTCFRSWKSMTSFRSWTPLAFSLATSASRSSTAKQTWLNPSLVRLRIAGSGRGSGWRYSSNCTSVSGETLARTSVMCSASMPSTPMEVENCGPAIMTDLSSLNTCRPKNCLAASTSLTTMVTWSKCVIMAPTLVAGCRSACHLSRLNDHRKHCGAPSAFFQRDSRLTPGHGSVTSGAGPEILRDRSLDQGLERLSIELFSLPDVDGATPVSLQAGVEEPQRVRHGGPPGEGQLDHLVVGLARADDPSVGPYGHPQRVARLDPFTLLHDVRVRLVDKTANLRQGLGAPATQRTDPLVEEMSGRRVRALRFRT